MSIYYNEIDKDCCAWLKELMHEGFISKGDVDDRSIKDVSSGDVRGYTRCHWFAGIGTWDYCLRQAGVPDDYRCWTGSAPCQPFSVAGQQLGESDPRHLWPDFFRLIDACRPARLFGEQVSGKAGYAWLDGVTVDLESKDYACWAYDIPAASVDAPHIRNRLYWIAKHLANSDDVRRNERKGEVSPPDKRAISRRKHDGVGECDEGRSVEHSEIFGRRQGRPEPELRRGWDAFASADAPGDVADAGQQHGRTGPAGFQKDGEIRADVHGSRAMGNSYVPVLAQRKSLSGDPRAQRAAPQRANDASFWSDAEWITCHDGKARRTQRGISLLAPRTAGRLHMWRALGNAICAPLAIEVIKAFMESEAGGQTT